MSNHFDGFVIPVPNSQIDRCCELAELSAAVWREHRVLFSAKYRPMTPNRT